ncbi:MAG TPA: hypothetical protein VHW60_14780 [Caulobacteraceae bacterium]|jgi:hypothetical protein|nr:hypothetical protein [Caulobacteraceae bacterium]
MANDSAVLERAPALKVQLKSASALAFAPNGVLLVGDGLGAAVYAYETGDVTPGACQVQIEDLTGKIAALLGTTSDQIRVPDIAVNPASGAVYLAVARGAGADADHLILRADHTGALTELDLDATPHTSVALSDQPDADKVDRRGNALRTDTITDLGYAGGKVIVAGLSNEEFASTLRAFPYPFTGATKGAAIEIWHGAHGAYETNAPIRTFISYEFDGEPEILASYTCTPLVRIPVSKLTPGAKVMGMTIAELGNMNRPLDMIAYRKDGSDHILMANSNRGVMKLDANHLDQYGPITDKIAATHGVPYETIGDLQGVRRLDRLGEHHALAMVATGEALNLTTIALP